MGANRKLVGNSQNKKAKKSHRDNDNKEGLADLRIKAGEGLLDEMQIIENIIKENIDKHVRAEKVEKSEGNDSDDLHVGFWMTNIQYCSLNMCRNA